MPTGFMRLWVVLLSLFTAFALGCASGTSQKSTGQYVDDATITAKVKAKLLEDKQVSGLAINVDTYKQTVQLNGFVSSDAEKQKAAELAKSVEGVKSVQNNLAVKK
jgi:hyperosmotically inducible protein